MRRRIIIKTSKILAGFALVTILAANLAAQGIYATLTGLITDQSDAVVPQAKVTLKDAQSGSQRDTVTNSEGYFTFASVPVGTYDLTIEAKGFGTYKVDGITLNGGDKRNIDAQLTVGSTAQAVEITGAIDSVTPVDSGEKSDIITTKELQNFVSVGSNAAEFIKIMPGFGIQNGTSNKSNYTGETIGINANGDAGSQSPLNNAYLLQRPAQQLAGHHGGWRARLRPGLQLRYAGESQLGHDLRVPGEDVELQRRKPEGTGGDHLGGQIGRQGFPRFGVLLCPQLRVERQ